MSEKNPSNWMWGAKAEYVCVWEWDLDVFTGLQEWGDNHGCRFLLTPEYSLGQTRQYRLQLYVAPKPTSKSTGLDEHALSTRDRALENFPVWFTGYLQGKGAVSLSDTLLLRQEP
jgi:hypothetical protein